MRIAERDNGVVINADALQVYDCWRVLSARPSETDTVRAPHALYGHVSANIRYSVGNWLDDLAPLLGTLEAAGQRPIIIGGTALYLTALTSGLADIPPIEPEVRRLSQAMIDGGRLAAMIADLERLDPRTHARIDLANPMRVQRAWEVLRSTGRSLTQWQDETPPPMLPRTGCACFVVHPAVPAQHAAIEARFRKMVTLGALDEARDFLASGVSETMPSARALGAEDLMRHLRGECSLEDAIARAVTVTRQFSKRQRQWFRGRMADWDWIDPADGDPLKRIPPE